MQHKHLLLTFLVASAFAVGCKQPGQAATENPAQAPGQRELPDLWNSPTLQSLKVRAIHAGPDKYVGRTFKLIGFVGDTHSQPNHAGCKFADRWAGSGPDSADTIPVGFTAYYAKASKSADGKNIIRCLASLRDPLEIGAKRFTLIGEIRQYHDTFEPYLELLDIRPGTIYTKNADPLETEAIRRAEASFEQLLSKVATKVGGSVFVEMWERAGPLTRMLQCKEISSDLTVSEPDPVNGVEWVGEVLIRAKSSRVWRSSMEVGWTFSSPKGWSVWFPRTDSEDEPLLLWSSDLIKENGQWESHEAPTGWLVSGDISACKLSKPSPGDTAERLSPTQGKGGTTTNTASPVRP